MGCCASKTSVSDAKGLDVSGGLQENQEDIRDKYELGKLLGSGSFGQVREAVVRDATPREVRACKVIERDNEDKDWSQQAVFCSEVQLLQKMTHENIIKYFDFFIDPLFLYVVMEICSGGEVFAKIIELKRFREQDAAYLGRQMLRAIEYIHSCKVMHRDIKAENFMLSKPEITSSIKMIDFGMASKFEKDQKLTQLCGSPHYLAPELIGQKYSYHVDIWSFGVLMYLLMYGHYPYDGKKPRDIMTKIITDPITWQTKAKLSEDGLHFVKHLLVHDYKKRPGATEALSHRWMAQALVPEEKPTDGKDSGNVLPTEIIRSAHKKVTAQRTHVDAKVEKARNDKLARIEEDFSQGIRHGQRLGPTPKEEMKQLMDRPEFVRRDNNLVSAPSNTLNNRRTSMQKLLGMNKLGAVAEGGEAAAGKNDAGRSARSCSVSALPAAGVVEKRGFGSYLGPLTKDDEKGFQAMFNKLVVVPEAGACGEEEEEEMSDVEDAKEEVKVPGSAQPDKETEDKEK